MHPLAGLQDVFVQGDGCMSLAVITARSSVSLVVGAMHGDATAKTVLTAADLLLRQIHRRSHRSALCCTLCDAGRMWRNEPPHAITVLLPFGVDAPRAAAGLAICADCAEARTDTALAHAAVGKLRSVALPDPRVLQPMEAGHA